MYIPDPNEAESKLLHDLVHFDGAAVLDVGSGEGRLSRHFAPHSAHTVLVDPDEAELTEARKKLAASVSERCSFHAGKAEHLPFAAGQFALVVFSWSL